MNQVHLVAVTLARHEGKRYGIDTERFLEHTLCNIALVSTESRTFLETMCDHQAKNTCTACLRQRGKDHKVQPVLLLGTGW